MNFPFVAHFSISQTRDSGPEQIGPAQRGHAEAELLRRARNGEREAVGLLFNRSRERIFNLAFQILRERDAAEDAAQEILLRAFEKMPGFRGESEFSTWIYRLALNHCLEKRRVPDLAQSALQLQPTLNSFNLYDAYQVPNFDGLPQNAATLAQGHWLSSWLLRLAWWSAAAWLISVPLTLWNKASATNRRSAMVWTAFGVGATGAMLLAAIHLGAVKEMATDIYREPKPPTFDIETNFSFLLALLWAASVVIPSLRVKVSWPRFQLKLSPIQPDRKINWLHILRFLLYLGAIGGAVTTVLAMRSQPLDSTISGQIWPFQLLLLFSCLAGTCLFHVASSAGLKRLGLFFLSSALLLFIMAGASALDQSAEPSEANLPLMIVTYSAGVFFLIGAFLWARGASAKERENDWFEDLFGDLATRIPATAAALALCSSLVYLMVALGTIPTRHHAQQMIDWHLQNGEVAFIEKQTSKNLH